MGRVQGPFRDDTPAGDLQRALDMEIVDHLRTQNAKLMGEIDRLKKHRSQHGSTSSWSEVGGLQQQVLECFLDRLGRLRMGVMNVGGTILQEVLKSL